MNSLELKIQAILERGGTTAAPSGDAEWKPKRGEMVYVTDDVNDTIEKCLLREYVEQDETGMHRAWNMDKTDKVGWHYVYQKIL
jgi:hypothetical protein